MHIFNIQLSLQNIFLIKHQWKSVQLMSSTTNKLLLLFFMLGPSCFCTRSMEFEGYSQLSVHEQTPGDQISGYSTSTLGLLLPINY